MQLIEHLARTCYISLTAERPLRIMECVAVIPAILKFGLDQLLPKRWFIRSGLPGVRMLPMGESTPAWVPAIGSHLLYLWRCHARTRKQGHVQAKARAVPMCASFTRQWMR